MVKILSAICFVQFFRSIPLDQTFHLFHQRACDQNHSNLGDDLADMCLRGLMGIGVGKLCFRLDICLGESTLSRA